MTDQPNLKKIVLDYVIEEYAHGRTVNLRDLAAHSEFTVDKLAEQEYKLYPAVNCGTTPVCPWPWKRQEAERLYDIWGESPPECIDQVDWVDE